MSQSYTVVAKEFCGDTSWTLVAESLDAAVDAARRECQDDGLMLVSVTGPDGRFLSAYTL